MATVQPISDKKHLKIVEKHIVDNFDEAYLLLWRVGCETGYRVTDITELKYSDIDFDTGSVTIEENKGTRARRARARLKVLSAVKNELIAANISDPVAMMRVFITPPKDIYPMIPDWMLASVDLRISNAVKATQAKTRTAKLGKRTLDMMTRRKDRYLKLCGDSVFSRASLSSNRAKNLEGNITRQACWKVFKTITDVMAKLGESVKVACHSMRKTFARHLYESTGKNIGLVMKIIGHSSQEMTLIYLGISGEEELKAQEKMLHDFE